MCATTADEPPTTKGILITPSDQRDGLAPSSPASAGSFMVKLRTSSVAALAARARPPEFDTYGT